MSDPLDPATMDALNALGDQIEAESGKANIPAQDGAGAETGGETEHEAAEGEEAAAEAQEGQEATSENEAGEDGEGTEDDKPPAIKATGAEKRIKELTREKYEARSRAEQAIARAEEEKARREAAERKLAEFQSGHVQPQVDVAPQNDQQRQPVVQRQGESGLDFEARVQAEASRRAAAAAHQERANAFTLKGVQQFENFNAVCNTIAETFNHQIQMHPEFMQAAFRLDNGQAVLHHLGNNLEELDALFAKEPVEVIMAMKELSSKLKTPKAQRVSNAPPPINPTRGSGGGRTGTRLDDDKAPMDEWSKQFLKDLAS